jgi:ABC-type lipoprotein export system ATPase subunit
MVTHDPALAEMASHNVHILDGRVSNGTANLKVARVATA